MPDKNLKVLDFNDKNISEEVFFKNIYLENYPSLIVFAKGYVKQIPIAEDLVEDVFVKLWKNRQVISTIQNLKVYLFIAVKNTCFNYLVKLKKYNIQSIDDLDIDFEQITATAEGKIISSERVELINNEINKLPKKCKAIFILIKEEGLKYTEVAQLLNLSIKTVETQMSIAFKRLSQALASEFPEKFDNNSKQI
nr:RNA polymerase sigma-70 factor [Pseudopedobacter sp.]